MNSAGFFVGMIRAVSRREVAIACFCVLLTTGSPAAEREPASLRTDVPFTDHVHRQYRDYEGLPSNWIYDLVQTRDGYVWVATHNGVARFDGLRFRIFRRSNTPQLPANDTRVLFESRDGDLWIGTVGGLARYHPGRPGSFETFDVFAGNTVHAIHEDSGGKLWIGTREETWVGEPDGDFELAPNTPSRVKAICEDADGTMWFGSDTGLYRRQDTTLEHVGRQRLAALAEGTGAAVVGVNVLLAEGTGVWVGCSHGLLRIENGDFRKKGEEIGQRRINDLFKTRDGGVYAATHTGLYRSVGSDPFVALETDARTECIMEDREGGLWVGHTINLGLHYFRNSMVRTLLTEHRVNCVYEDAQGHTWFGAFSGLHRLRDGELSSYGVADGLPHVNVQTVTPGPGGTLWIGTRQGLAIWSGRELSTPVAPMELARLSICSMFFDSAGLLWLSLDDGGGCTLSNGVVERIHELEHGNITWFYEDSAGTIWIGHEYGLFRREHGRIRQVTDPAFERLGNRHFTCYHAAEDGTLWLGTSGGVARYQAAQFDVVNSEDGLADDYVDRIHEDAHGRLWFAGRDGFFYASSKEMHEVASGQRRIVVCHRVEPVAGVPASRCHPSGWLSKDGALWIAAKQGVIRVSAEPPAKPAPPAVRIERVRIDGRTMPADRPREFWSGRHRLAIDFAVPTFVNRHGVHVKYRLHGYDAGWVEAGDEQVAYYTDLGPKNYRFQVIAASGDVWNEEGASLAFLVKPFYWQTSWFRLAAAATLLGLSGLLTRWRLGIKHRRQMAEITRTQRQQTELAHLSRVGTMGQLASSLAHELNQPLGAILRNTEAAELLLQPQSPDLDEIRAIFTDIHKDNQRAGEVIDRMRAMIKQREIEPRSLDLERLARDVLALVRSDAVARRMRLGLKADPPPPPVHGDLVQLQQVLLNLILNAMDAMENNPPETRLVEVRIRSAGDAVEIAVRDKGSGVPPDQLSRVFEPFVSSKANGLGMGLAISHRIIEAHEGRLRAENNPDGGATFTIALPVGEQKD